MSKIEVTLDGHTYQVDVDLHRMVDSSLTVNVDGEAVDVTMPNLNTSKQMEWILIDNRPYEIVLDRNLQWIKAYSGLHRLEIRDLEAAVPRPLSGDGRVKAPIPGLITQVLVEKGQRVEVGQPLLVLEAMKMENEILAPRSGIINHLNVKPNQSVILQEVLVEID